LSEAGPLEEQARQARSLEGGEDVLPLARDAPSDGQEQG
jgi:hypothetical protein